MRNGQRKKKKKAECQRIDAFKLWCWRRLLRVLGTTRRSNQSSLKEISPEYSLEGLMLMLKLQYFGHIGKDPDAGKDWRREEKGTTEDEMVGWHHWLNGHEFEQASGDGEGQGSLVCCSPWGRKESDMSDWVNWTELNWSGNYNSSIAMYLQKLKADLHLRKWDVSHSWYFLKRIPWNSP